MKDPNTWTEKQLSHMDRSLDYETFRMLRIFGFTSSYYAQHANDIKQYCWVKAMQALNQAYYEDGKGSPNSFVRKYMSGWVASYFAKQGWIKNRGVKKQPATLLSLDTHKVKDMPSIGSILCVMPEVWLAAQHEGGREAYGEKKKKLEMLYPGKCNQCEADIKPGRMFCNMACRNRYIAASKRKWIKCAHCPNMVSYKRKYCSWACYNNSRKGNDTQHQSSQEHHALPAQGVLQSPHEPAGQALHELGGWVSLPQGSSSGAGHTLMGQG